MVGRAIGNGQTRLVKKVASGQRRVFFGLRVWSKKVFGSRARTRVFTTRKFPFFTGAGEYLLSQTADQFEDEGDLNPTRRASLLWIRASRAALMIQSRSSDWESIGDTAGVLLN